MLTKIWLDDVRPAPPGWLWCKTVDEAKTALLAGPVEEMSLDHDLGMDEVVDQLSPEGRAALQRLGTVELSPEDDGVLLLHAMELIRNGRVHHNGYALCLWMAEQNRWPLTKPRVHSANGSGAARMQGVIDRHWAPTGRAPQENR